MPPEQTTQPQDEKHWLKYLLIALGILIIAGGAYAYYFHSQKTPEQTQESAGSNSPLPIDFNWPRSTGTTLNLNKQGILYSSITDYKKWGDIDLEGEEWSYKCNDQDDSCDKFVELKSTQELEALGWTLEPIQYGSYIFEPIVADGPRSTQQGIFKLSDNRLKIYIWHVNTNFKGQETENSLLNCPCDYTYGVFVSREYNFDELIGLIEATSTDWQTYRNEEYGFEFKYPNHWTIDIDSHNGNPIIYIAEETEGYPNGITVHKSSGTLIEVDSELRANSTILDSRNILENGIPWHIYSYKDTRTGDIFISYITENNDGIISINADEGVETIDLINQILSTFKFTQ